MGIIGLQNNNKKAFKSQKSTRWQRQCKAEKKKNLPAASLDIDNIHLFSKEKLKNKLKNPKNNIKISGKKFRRLTKRLGHRIREKSQMEIEAAEKTSRSDLKPEDEVMQDAGEEAVTGTQITPPALPSSSSSSRKKKRGGKKHKKKTAEQAGGSEGKMFQEEEGWEDVDME
ncbi:uncharacterized protein LOC131936133 [Physella acuta]|uniref:uncharacterized protein LOC131936133 n=1 Tax=Physella acuta TaxID=109671 RepID=UPI0027DB29AC|nr:uncharacterized protein LOC131936133 [Physella acuta]XP_059149032.1 uncharacterized protein LOC131936133 [Physella acuta]XP_059149040.1 uncharacterized protein LOC131936133 [Physella acuta]XP_059149047.1 uncharacterized protein LOC131936133 [Physella acuta]